MGFFTGSDEGGRAEGPLDELRTSLNRAILPPGVRVTIERELGVLERLNMSSQEHSIGISYVNYLLGFPWGVKVEETLDIGHVERVLGERHYGLGPVKQRILEHLAVMRLRQGSQRVLVVDDDETALKNLRHILGVTGAEVLTASDPLQALALVEAEELDVVLTDLKMRGMGGLELLERIKARAPGLPVIVVTGYGSIDSAVECMRHGAFHYITKPFDIAEVRGAVARAGAANPGRTHAEGHVLCLAGPPGSGKTSLGRAIADALGRPFVRISLGGIKDESEIRGHRRTYAGAMPGRIVQEIRRVGCTNPLIMLDEIDKTGGEASGSAPLAALLEVLDPEQHRTFLDHYMDVPLDLSSVLFIATANVPDLIPEPLRDRMELMELEGYALDDKVRIAMDFLTPRQARRHGLGSGFRLTEGAAREIAEGYTLEAGIRQLDRQIASICRKKAVEALARPGADRTVARPIEAGEVAALLGPPRYARGAARPEPGVGGALGLVIGEYGGDVITIETLRMKGTGQLLLTGNLGEVMRESARAALSFVRSRARALGIDEDSFGGLDIHVHIPAGAIAKDGPSAGATITLALISLFTSRRPRPGVAITGEVTLSGTLLPVGGLRQKLLAARRIGISRVLLPEANRAVAAEFDQGGFLVFCSHIQEMIPIALEW